MKPIIIAILSVCTLTFASLSGHAARLASEVQTRVQTEQARKTHPNSQAGHKKKLRPDDNDGHRKKLGQRPAAPAQAPSKKQQSVQAAEPETVEVVEVEEVTDIDIVPSYTRIDETNRVYDMAEVPPAFPGGEAQLYKFLAEHMRYPEIAQENGIEGRVIVRFVVQKDGSIGEVKVARSVDPALDQEAIRIVKSFPNFIPGKNNGQPVNVWYTLPVRFKLQM